MKAVVDWGQRLMAVAWPAFLAACVLELLVFAVADPLELHWAGGLLGWSRQAVYTVAFFVFWAVPFGACALTVLLRMTPPAVNGLPDAVEDGRADAPGA